MNDIELEQDLKKHYQKLYGNPPAPEVTWSQITPHLTPHTHSIMWWRRPFITKHYTTEQIITAPGKQLVRRPVRRVSVALLILLIGLLVLTATSYAATGSSPLSALFSLMGVKPIAQNFSDYHQSKSIDGYTITIQKAYADSNRVILGYTGKTPAKRNLDSKFALIESKLITEQGTELRPMSGIESDNNTENISGNLFEFDTSSIQGTPKDLHLHLAVPYGSQSPSTAFHTTGYLTFDFSVPFHPGKTINTNTSVTASGKSVTASDVFIENGKKVHRQVTTLNGHTITLQRVVISSSETRAYIKGFTYDSFDSSFLYFNITVNGRNYSSGMSEHSSDVWPINFSDSSLSTQKGLWTLTVQQKITQIDPQTGQFTMKIVATCQFTFTVK